MSISLNPTGSGTVEGGPVQIEVTGHPELSGNYTTEEAAALGIGVARTAAGYLVNDNRPLHNVEPCIVQINGKPRIVAVKQ